MSRKTVNIAPKEEKAKPAGGRRWLWWGLGGLVVLVVMSAVFGDDPTPDPSPSTGRGDEIELPTRVVTDPAPSPSTADEVTVTVEASATITETVMPTVTATITNTPEPTVTATITNTPEPTATVSPEDVAMAIIDGNTSGEVISLTVNSFAVVSRFEMRQDFSGYSADMTHTEMVNIVCDLRDVFSDHRIIMDAVINVVDGFGNESQRSGVTVTFEPATVSLINCDNVFNVNLRAIADGYDIDRLLNE